MKKETSEIGKKIQQYMAVLNIKSYNELAKNCGMVQSTIYDIISGKNKSPRLISIEKIAKGLGITLKDIFTDIKEEDVEKEYRKQLIINQLDRLDIDSLDSLLVIAKNLPKEE